MDCSKTGVSNWCNNRNVKVVQMRSQTAGPNGSNKFEGAIVNMCEECRKSNCGNFKIVKPTLFKQTEEDARRQRAAKALYDETMSTP